RRRTSVAHCYFIVTSEISSMRSDLTFASKETLKHLQQLKTTSKVNWKKRIDRRQKEALEK
ncbi:MAG TPA: hypothetical protein VMD05_08370, partial [Candidatus Nanoarchaeia archaeon]|nr:hypothetical protein [Candidatus Nanoarchaeia archaeon]